MLHKRLKKLTNEGIDTVNVISSSGCKTSLSVINTSVDATLPFSETKTKLNNFSTWF